MSLDIVRHDVEKGNPDYESSMSSNIQPASRDERQPTVAQNPIHPKSMLSRRSSIPLVVKNQKTKASRRWKHFSRSTGSGHNSHSIPSQIDADETLFKTNTESILQLIRSGGSCIPPSTNSSKPVKLPRFDDLRAYVPSDDVAQVFWAGEADRLVNAAKDTTPLLAFDGKATFNHGNQQEYQDLGRLAEMILSALSLCMLDNECIYVKSCKPLANRDRLKKFIQQAQVSRTNSLWEEVGGDSTQESSEKNEIREARKREEEDAVSALIDYIFAILARLLAQTAVGKYWSDNVLCVLTQRIAKLKVLLTDMPTYTMISCQAGEACLDQSDISTRLSNGIMDEEECEEVLRMIDAERKEGLTTADNAEVARYCVDQNRFRAGIDTILRYLLLSLRFHNRSGLQATSFEICGTVYDTGFEDFKALLFQDRDLEYSATSDQDSIKTAYPAFMILHEALQDIVKHRAPMTTSNFQTTSDFQTTVEWRYCDFCDNSTTADNARKDLSICEPQKSTMRTMSEVITVMIPLILTSPVVVSNLTKFRAAVALACDAKDIVQPSKYRDYCAFFRMYTSQFERDSNSWEVMRLSAAVQNGVFSRNILIEGDVSSKGTVRVRGDPSKVQANALKVQNKLMEMSQEMDRWVIDERSVTVACKYQVCSIFSAAFIIAGGGLAMIACKDRIKGVDPSNLSMYLWILAGFYLLVQKSRFVEDWPWSDFLRFRVRCRSVSELHAISNINEQLIMAKLLHDERGGSLLKTRGPYNKVFLQRDSNDGFAIDCSLNMTTLLLSGLVMLKVLTPRGHALVCLDARRGTELKVVEHQSNPAQEHLVCEDIDRLQDRHDRENPKDKMKLQLAMSKDLKWKRIQGVFEGMEVGFV